MSAPTVLVAGATVHLLRGSKYAGCWTLATVGEPDAHGWRAITGTDRCEWFTRGEDAFATEADARAAAKARRKPRSPKTAQPLYGDFAQLARLNGIATDGTGRVNR